MNEEYLEIVASIGEPAEITAAVTGEASIQAAVDQPTEIAVEVVAAGPRGPKGDTGDTGPQGIPGQDGQDGADGADGVSPTVSVSSITGGHQVDITDAGGTTSFNVMDGADGQDGTNGTNGQDGTDGVSPEVTIASITGGHSVTITDADHPGGQTFNVMDGVDGQDGTNGTNGQDGAAATIAVGTVSGLPAGSTPTVVNSGTSNAAVFDFGIPKGDKGDTGNTGATGPAGPGVPDGGAEATILRKHSGTDQDTEWYPPFIPYGQLDNTSTATVMTATIPGVTKLEDGVCIMLKNGVITSASGVTLNINGLGAKPIYSSMAATTAISTVFNANYTMLFVYDSTRVAGGCWVIYYGYNANDNTIGYQLRTNNTILKTADACRYYKIFFTSADGTHWVPASANTKNSATTLKTVNQRKIDPWGRIAYTSASTSYAAEADIAAGTLWSQYNLTLGYSFNWTGAALTLTSNSPVYVKAAPQTDGSAIMDSTTPIVQALPNTDDGKIYIFLGIATSATQVELYQVHPVYYYKDSAIRLWTNAPSGGGGGSTDIFWATYGSTSVADIDAALAADQVPCVLKDDVVYVYGYAVDDKRYFGSTVLQSLSYKYLVNDNGTWSAASAAMHGIPSGGNAGQVLKKNSATDYDVGWTDQTQVYPSAYCITVAGTAAKKASCSLWADTANSYLHILVGAANTYAGAITLNVNSTGAKPVYINGEASSATNYTLPAGSYIAFYDGTNFHFRTDGKLPNVPVASSSTPQALGTAAAGSSADFSRADHVHTKPTYSKSDVGLGSVDNVKQYSATNPPPYPVTSVNGSTGAVTVSVPSAYTSTPADLGTAAAGSSTSWAKGDHVHKMPSASDVGAVATSALLDLVYPVGSLYWSSVSTDPGTLFGGTWTAVKDVFILAAGDTYTAGSTGGAATHTLTVDEIPSHRHGYDRYTGSQGSGSPTSSGSAKNVSSNTDYTGGGQAHNNMPPYKVYYCWERTA